MINYLIDLTQNYSILSGVTVIGIIYLINRVFHWITFLNDWFNEFVKWTLINANNNNNFKYKDKPHEDIKNNSLIFVYGLKNKKEIVQGLKFYNSKTKKRYKASLLLTYGIDTLNGDFYNYYLDKCYKYGITWQWGFTSFIRLLDKCLGKSYKNTLEEYLKNTEKQLKEEINKKIPGFLD